jgi:hypothetical protein
MELIKPIRPINLVLSIANVNAPFGRCRCAIRFGAGQDRQLPDPVSLTLARAEVPIVLALRLFLPESWTSKRTRLERADAPAEYGTARTKP